MNLIKPTTERFADIHTRYEYTTTYYLLGCKAGVAQSPAALLQARYAPWILHHGKEGREKKKKKNENTALGGISAWDAQSDFREVIN